MGPRGTVSHFESLGIPGSMANGNGIGIDDDSQRIGNTDDREYHRIELEKLGGLDAVDSAWIEAIDSELHQ